MISSTPHCNAEQLKRLLADRLPSAEHGEVADHLAVCPPCRQALEDLAGDATWWSEVQTCFQAREKESGSGQVLSRTSSPRSLSALPTPAPHLRSTSEPISHIPEEARNLEGANSYETFTIDFVVDFLEPSDNAQALGRLGEYEVLEVIGRGGMGVVLKGFHKDLGRFVAIKVIVPHLAASGAARQRFVREARAAAAIVHPHVMPIHSVSTEGRLPYLVMPYVGSESLQQRIDRQGMLEVKEIVRIGKQSAEALAAAHSQGLIHRDVKPANILVDKGVDRILLTDFGLARAVDDGSLTRTGFIAGTPQYMSPEQAQGEAIDHRSDLFSLGSVLYAMCTGQPPFRADTTLGLLRRISDKQPRPVRELNPDIPVWLEAIVGKLHEKDPKRRYGSAQEVAEIFGQYLAHLHQPRLIPAPDELVRIVPSAPNPSSPASILVRTSRKNRLLVQFAKNRLRKITGLWNTHLAKRFSLSWKTAIQGAGLILVCLAAIVMAISPRGPAPLATEQNPEASSDAREATSDEAIDREFEIFDSDLRGLEQRNSHPWKEEGKPLDLPSPSQESRQ